MEDARIKDFKDAIEPIIEYLYKYGTLHDTVVVSMEKAEHLRGELGMSIELRD